MKTIIFDDTCTGWVSRANYHELFIQQQTQYIHEKIRYRGYIYLSEIYEIFGAAWDPHDKNEVWIVNERDIKVRCRTIGENKFKIDIEGCIH